MYCKIEYDKKFEKFYKISEELKKQGPDVRGRVCSDTISS